MGGKAAEGVNTMNSAETTNAQVHRLNGQVAIWVDDGDGLGLTVYFGTVDARKIARAINRCAADIRVHSKDSESQFSTFWLRPD